MRKPAPDAAAWAMMKSEIRAGTNDVCISWNSWSPVPVLLWSHMLDLIYSGHADVAWRLMDETWATGWGG